VNYLTLFVLVRVTYFMRESEHVKPRKRAFPRVMECTARSHFPGWPR